MWTGQWIVSCAFNGSVHWSIPQRNIQNAIRMTDVCVCSGICPNNHVDNHGNCLGRLLYIQVMLADCLQHLKILSTLGDENCDCPIYLNGINSTIILIASDKEFND